jgi:hypothetical protein
MPTNYNRANLITESATLFPDNNTQEISPADLRQWLEDGTTSFVTQKDKSTLENAIFENKASTLASGATVDLNTATGNYLHISGTSTINSFGTCPAGARFIIVFDAAATLTYNATSLIIPGLANKTAAAGDCCMIVSEGSGNWRIVGYFAISGGGGGGSVTAVTGTAPIASSGGTAPDISIPQANGSTDGFLDSADWTTFNGKQDVLSAGTGISIIANVVTNTAPSSGGTVTTTGTPSSGQITKFSGATSITNASAGTDYVAPGAATGSGLTMATSRLLGRTTASTGAIEEISLTTTGTSGAATLSGGNLNIPQYSGGGTLTIGSSVVSGATAGRLLLTTTSGANQVLNQDSLLNYDTTNDRLGIGIASPTATLHLAAGVAANPQMLLVPSSVTPTGTTNGSIWCNTVSSNTRLTMYKDSALTNVITLDRNPDLATSGSGIVQADANGTLSKGADLTALGIYAETVGSTIQNTTTTTSVFNTVTGVTSLPANFFAVGKTITIFISGTYAQQSGSNTCTISLSIGGVAMGSIALTHGNIVSATYFDAQFTLTCRTAGASGTIQYQGKGVLNTSSPSFYFQSSTTSGSINTTTANTIAVTGTWSAANAANILVTGIHYANYIN